MPNELENLRLLRATERKLFLRTLLAIDEQLDLQNYERAKYVVEQTYILLTEYPIHESEKKND